jgi:hypothetical protein
MILEGETLRRVAETLSDKNVKLYHACQLQDFRSYVALGGVASRQRLEQAHVNFTPFDSDAVDQQHGVWDKVFGNLDDFDRIFANLANPNTSTNVPNPYGPITLEISPNALAEAVDLAICLRSAYVRDFNRAAEGLTHDEIEQLYALSENGYWSLKFTSKLRQEQQSDGAFRGRQIQSSPEFSATFEDGVLPLRYVRRITVQQLHHAGRSLIAVINAEGPYGFHVNLRNYKNSQDVRFDRLAALSWAARGADDHLQAGENLNAYLTADDERSGFAQYIRGVVASTTARNLANWGTYLNVGTLRPMEQR